MGEGVYDKKGKNRGKGFAAKVGVGLGFRSGRKEVEDK